jgi:hypothetical protein
MAVVPIGQLEAISAKDIGIWVNHKDFLATQEMTEETRQEITYRGGFGTDGPVARSVRTADSGTLSFSALLLTTPLTDQPGGPAKRMNAEDTLKTLEDFTIICKRGGHVLSYEGCNWERITVRSTLTEVTLDADVQYPPGSVSSVEAPDS